MEFNKSRLMMFRNNSLPSPRYSVQQPPFVPNYSMRHAEFKPQIFPTPPHILINDRSQAALDVGNVITSPARSRASAIYKHTLEETKHDDSELKRAHVMSPAVCNNCGKTGHVLNNCKMPIVSYGLIVYVDAGVGLASAPPHGGSRKYLMICRRHSYGFIDFVNGKYTIYDQPNAHLCNLVNEMTDSERLSIVQTPNIGKLWQDMWGSKRMFKEDVAALTQKKYELVRPFLPTIIANCPDRWQKPEWECPKGRKAFGERSMETAKREFQEETGYNSRLLSLIENVSFEELFVGSNFKSYKNVYFVAKYNGDIDFVPKFQESEVSEVRWMTLDECLSVVRPYNTEKIETLQKVDKMLNEFCVV